MAFQFQNSIFMEGIALKASKKSITVKIAKPRNNVVRSLAYGLGSAEGRHGDFKPQKAQITRNLARPGRYLTKSPEEKSK